MTTATAAGSAPPPMTPPPQAASAAPRTPRSSAERMVASIYTRGPRESADRPLRRAGTVSQRTASSCEDLIIPIGRAYLMVSLRSTWSMLHARHGETVPHVLREVRRRADQRARGLVQPGGCDLPGRASGAERAELRAVRCEARAACRRARREARATCRRTGRQDRAAHSPTGRQDRAAHSPTGRETGATYRGSKSGATRRARDAGRAAA